MQQRSLATEAETANQLPGWLLGGYLVLIVYGSLVPFELRNQSLSLADAWQVLLGARYLELGVSSRADWVANLLLYMPLGYLVLERLSSAHPRWMAAGLVAAMALGTALAVAVEYLQIFVAPRTVSRNDLLAEVLGTGAGAAAHVLFGGWLRRSWSRVRHGGRGSLAAGLGLYAVLYLGFSLFPFDFLISARELHWKWHSGSAGILLAPALAEGWLRAAARLLAEIAAVVPIGLALALYFGPQRRMRQREALLIGLGLGLGIEAAQFLLASGVSQGLSVGTRVLGVWLGVRCHQKLDAPDGMNAPGWLRRALPYLLAPYLVLLMALSGWFSNRWAHTIEETAWGLTPKMFLPFYFHYYTTEVRALSSVLGNAVMYAPIAVGVWLRRAPGERGPTSGRVVVLVLLLASVIEAGKLLVIGKHPDPTNLLIAGAAAWITLRALRWLAATAGGCAAAVSSPEKGEAPDPPAPSRGATLPVTRRTAPRTATPAAAQTTRSPLRWALAVTLLGGTLFTLRHYPVQPALLGAGLVAYAAWLWFRPDAWLLAVPTAIPVLDFAEWTGWFFVDELDLLLAVTLATLLARGGRALGLGELSPVLRTLLIALVVTYAVSLWRGLGPLDALDSESLASYLSHYNALRLGKGVLWAVVLLPFLAPAIRRRDAVRRYLLPGLLLGLLGISVHFVIERWVFTGLLNFASAFRATGFLSSMHTGGSSIDAYLALVLPSVGACALVYRTPLAAVLGGVLFTLGAYAALSTFSRINFLALGLAAAVLLIAMARDARLERRFFALTLPLVAIAALLLVLVFRGPYIQVRWSTLGEDWDLRARHLASSLELGERGWPAALLGNGVGSFPRLYFWAGATRDRPATIAYPSDGENTWLRLGSGRPTYVLQRLFGELRGSGTISLRARADAEASLGVVVCEKSLLYSVQCVSSGFKVPADPSGWQRFRAPLELGRLGRRGRPVSLALFNPERSGPSVDVDDVSLEIGGRERLRNGSFEQASDRWFFTSDDHLSWHTQNLWVHTLLEQGWLGVLALASLLGVCLLRLGRSAVRGDPVSAVLLAAVTSGLTVGLTDSLLDAPRIALLLFLIVLGALLHCDPGPGALLETGSRRSGARKSKRERRGQQSHPSESLKVKSHFSSKHL